MPYSTYDDLLTRAARSTAARHGQTYQPSSVRAFNASIAKRERADLLTRIALILLAGACGLAVALLPLYMPTTHCNDHTQRGIAYVCPH